MWPRCGREWPSRGGPAMEERGGPRSSIAGSSRRSIDSSPCSSRGFTSTKGDVSQRSPPRGTAPRAAALHHERGRAACAPQGNQPHSGSLQARLGGVALRRSSGGLCRPVRDTLVRHSAATQSVTVGALPSCMASLALRCRLVAGAGPSPTRRARGVCSRGRTRDGWWRSSCIERRRTFDPLRARLPAAVPCAFASRVVRPSWARA